MRAGSADRDRWLALGLLAALLGLGYLVLVHPWWTVPMLQVDARIDDLRQRDLRARMALLQAPEVEKRLQAVRAQSAGVPGFMPQRSPELATSALVQRLETAVLEASPGNRSCAIINRSPLNEAGRQRFPRVAVQVRLRCGNPELAAVLHSLESGSPRLFVDNLNLLTLGNFRSRRRDDSQGSGGLDVSFDLYGYLRPPAGAPTDAR